MTAATTELVEFATSGSTGVPVVWLRSHAQLRAEAELVANTLAGPVDHVVCFAPRNHLYGKLFGDVLPGLLGVGVTDLSADPLAAPQIVHGRRTLYVCLPASWPVLYSAACRADLHGSFALHGAGPVTPAVSAAAAALGDAGLVSVELFGSTETGAVAHRPMTGDADEPWRLFPDVTLLDPPGPDGSCALRVRGPRVARPAGAPVDHGPEVREHRLDDVIHPLGPDRFLFLGRGSRLIKINGMRCDLDLIERALAEALPCLDAACVGVPDQVRGEHYELFVAGPAVDPAILAAALTGLPGPRAVHRLDRVPRTVTGKVKIDRLFALAAVTG